MAPLPSLPAILRDAFARRMAVALPPRIVAAIERQENTGEVLVKLIQLAVVGLWTTLYLVAPRTDLDTAFSPVPYALGGYMALNFIGLVWAFRRGLPNWAVYVNIVLDIAVLMVLIWSFHIQYRQPPSFYLKAPTLLYIFIFVALRALRFQPRFVIAAGLVAAAGWLVLTAYVIFSDPANTMITRNYVDYMTSNSVLVGAEIDKIISILMVTAILALALKRGNDLLVIAVAEQSAARDLSRFFDAEVADRIRSSETSAAAGEGVRREAAIVFIDIRGFTPMAATLDAGEVVAMLAAYQRRIVPLIQHHGGSIDKFLGDGIMATFGAVDDSPTCAADALRALDAVMAEAAAWSDEPALSRITPERVNAAVASGPVVFGTLGGENRLEYTTIGAAVNLAAKLEKHNKVIASRALTDGETYDRAVAQGYAPPHWPRRERHRLDAVDDEVELVVLYEIG
jgi:adenylate cyclase